MNLDLRIWGFKKLKTKSCARANHSFNTQYMCQIFRIIIFKHFKIRLFLNYFINSISITTHKNFIVTTSIMMKVDTYNN